MPLVTDQRIRAILGKAPKPTVVWQQQFDGFGREIRRIAASDWDKIERGDLWNYIHDLAYQELQPDLFRHAFPACLKFWYDTLLLHKDAAIGDADLHRALMRGNILQKMLTERERQRVYDFFIDGLVDRFDMEKDFAYHRDAAHDWVGRFNSLGIVAPVIPQIWSAWWSSETQGRAISAIRYATGLIYLNGENPIYPAWTRHEGGGGPYLTEWDCEVFDHAWLTSNLDFLRETLSPSYVRERVSAAAHRLAPTPLAPVAERIANDASARTDVIELRIDQLLNGLATLTLDQEHWD